ncbi:hypothetical protein [Oceanicola sp. S124]|uniref:hypothetical protein n=1 Tax=Oceanicola sp. S124 TaxID=1042378 RepID=UPI00025579F5|nr:hypothetical protein [Oceanicola sp. S124]
MANIAPAPEEVEALFTDGAGAFRFARWSRPIVPVVFGATDDSLPPLKGAMETVVLAAGHKMAETDPEFGANLMIFFMQDWQELADVPDMDKLVPGLDRLVPRLQAEDADQYRFFRFAEDNSIKAGFVFLRMQGALSQMPAADLGMEQMLKSMLLWGPSAFAGRSALAQAEGQGPALLRPDLAAVLRAGYDPVLPAFSQDPVLALRLSARAGQLFN